METFTPYAAFVGGALIGLAATLLLLCNGQIAGISGIVDSSVRSLIEKSYWQPVFVLGMLCGAGVFRLVSGGEALLRIDAPIPVIIAAGLLVGFGTRLGNGCTSGHGVCGIARFSRRSITATVTFMAFGFATVYIVRHVLGG